MMNKNESAQCPVIATLNVIGGKWKPIILYNLMSGTKRFGELAFRIPTISRKVLTQQLKDLERDGVVNRTYYKEIPPKVEYSLTDLGKGLSPVFKEMEVWGNNLFNHQ